MLLPGDCEGCACVGLVIDSVKCGGAPVELLDEGFVAPETCTVLWEHGSRAQEMRE